MSKIEKELVDATGVKAGKDRQAFLKKLHKAVMDLDEEKWEGLSEGAQKWANGVTKEIEKKADELSDFADAGKEKPAKVEKEVPAKGEKKAEAEKPAKPEKEAKAPAEKKPAVKKGPGKIDQLKAVILKNMKAKPEDLNAKITAAGIEVSPSTVTTVRSDFISSLRVLKKAGKLDSDFAETLAD